jgi:pullulanase
MGVPFIYAGEELYRDKKGVNNTFQSPDSINQINWDNKYFHNDVFEYYRGIIALRKQHPAFRIPTQAMKEKHLKFINLQVPNVVAYMLTDHANGDTWKNILVLHNGNRKAVEVELPTGNWTTVVYDTKLNLDGLEVVNTTKFILAPSSSTLMFEK